MPIVILFLTLFMTACGSSRRAPEETAKPDNAATRYAEGLHQGVNRAEQAADVANQRIAEFNKNVQQAAEPE